MLEIINEVEKWPSPYKSEVLSLPKVMVSKLGKLRKLTLFQIKFDWSHTHG